MASSQILEILWLAEQKINIKQNNTAQYTIKPIII